MRRNLVVLTLAILCVLAMTTGSLLAQMTPEQRAAYEAWHLSRFGVLPRPASSDPQVPETPSEPPQPEDPYQPTEPSEPSEPEPSDPGNGDELNDPPSDTDDETEDGSDGLADNEAYQAWLRSRFGSTGGGGEQGSGSPSTSPVTSVRPQNPNGLERSLIDLINQERVSVGLNPLQVDPYLVAAARIKAEDMVANDYYSHRSPVYGYASEMLRTFGISFRRSGENIAAGGYASFIHNRLMASSSHRRNILRPYWTHVGVGAANRAAGTYRTHGYYAVQIFIER